MRPLSLHLKGFTAFRDPMQIDFRELDLFALWGPTGSGKSSILDAITYALYGKVERVEGVRGESLTSLVTHGQPNMAVELDFEVGDKTYRVTRRTTIGGQSKVRLDRLEGDDWVSYGEGADSVTQVNKIIPALVGLDYDAFTRSVVLPQGKFAEFLSGDAKKRRDILTELLGLEMFGRMAKHANDIARAAKIKMEAKGSLLETEYYGIDAAAAKQAQSAAKALAKESKAATEAEELLEDLQEDWDEQAQKAEDLIDLGSQVDRLGAAYERHATALQEHADLLKTEAEAARTAREAVEAARKEHARFVKERAKTEEKYGALEELSELRAHAASLKNIERDAIKAAEVMTKQKRVEADAQKALKTQETQVKKAEREFENAQTVLLKRKDEHDRAHRHDLVGALTQGLESGDDCPVCERPLSSIPEVDMSALDAAKESMAKAEAQVESAQRALATATVAHAKADTALEEARRRATECVAEADEKTHLVEEARALLAKRLPSLKGDPIAEVERRMAELRELSSAEKEAADRLAEATDVSGQSQEALSSLTTEVAGIRGAVESSSLSEVVTRAGQVLGRSVKIKLPAKLPSDAGDLATAILSLREEVRGLRTMVAEAAEELLEHQGELLEKARAALPEQWANEVEGTDIKQLLSGARKLCRDLSKRAALAEKEASTVKEKLEKRGVIEKEIGALKKEHATYNALHRELKNDRIVQFLQAEALEVLAAAAGEHLKELSDGRYRLAFEDDRYYVIDGWNGDERRSVRTLSGGETFLASLGLALALSEQVQLLAVTERARLQSLFLDEGFGTLDAETLDVVVTAIGRLGNDGRLVGVITHVPELAESMPVRVEVIKGPRGSTIQMPGGLEPVDN